ncbi:MAG TPA: EscU/YscU/HrcU family type III secretion system export apparatus switch protein [Isosphaeraceae bacterium]|nr:EscU/YscU/HrcU family type III secretion system export apparatus switch protein [Isosphaeraceae bacterium]
MSEDRTQPASKRRRQLAREQGQVAHSPELTAAVGWLVAVAAWWFFGGDLGAAMVALVRGSLTGPTVLPADPGVVAARVRELAWMVAWPLTVILAGFAAGAVVAHQVQVRGLWATRLIVPDPARLWVPGSGPGLAARCGRLGWAAGKAILVVLASAWMLRAGWGELLRLSELDGAVLARGASRLVLLLAGVLAGVLLVLSGVDYGLRYSRFEAMLRTTTQEQREDQRAMEGDLAARAVRRRLAQTWRGDSARRASHDHVRTPAERAPAQPLLRQGGNAPPGPLRTGRSGIPVRRG